MRGRGRGDARAAARFECEIAENDDRAVRETDRAIGGGKSGRLEAENPGRDYGGFFYRGEISGMNHFSNFVVLVLSVGCKIRGIRVVGVVIAACVFRP